MRVLESDVLLKDTFSITGRLPQNLLDDYVEAHSWLESIGINVSPSRFNQYRKNIEKSVRPKSVEEAFRYLWMSAELHDICEVHKHLSQISSQAFIQKLRLAVKGPLLLDDESVNADANKGRNYTFELYCASRLARAGLSVSLDSISDIEFTLGDTRCHVECKRVFDEKRLYDLVIEAISQINKRCINDPNARGIVALSISRMVHKAIGMSANGVYADLFEMQSVMRELVGKWGIMFKKIFSNKSDKTIGILLHYKMPFIDRSTGATAFLNRFGLTSFDSGPDNLDLARKVSELLGNSVK